VWRAAGAVLGWGSEAWSGGAGADDHGQQRIVVTDGSRECQPSGLELLPDLPPRDFVLGGLTIAPKRTVGKGALGFWPALREVFPAPRQPRGRVHQPADLPSKLPLLRVPNREALLVLFQRPMTTVLRNPGATKRNCWPVGPTNGVVGETFPGPLGRAGGMAGPLGRPVEGRCGHQTSGMTNRSRGEVCRPSGRTGVGAVRDIPTRTGRRPAQRASHSPSQGRRPWWLSNHVRSGPTGRPFFEKPMLKTNCWPVGPKNGAVGGGRVPARWAGLGE